MRRCLKPWRLLLTTRENGGIAALEFGLIAPAFFIVLAATIDLGGELYTRFQLDAAIAAASNYVIVNADYVANNPTTLASNVASIVTTINSNVSANSTVVVNNGATATVTSGGAPVTSGTASSSYYCPSGTPSSATFWGSAVAQGTSCTGGGLAGQFVTITASYPYTAIMTGYSFATSGRISATAVVQTN